MGGLRAAPKGIIKTGDGKYGSVESGEMVA